MKYLPLLLFPLLPLSPGVAQNTALPSGTIDGQVTPELIPDVVAFRLFFTALAVDANPSAAQQQRQESLLCAAHLSDTDKHMLLLALPDFKARLDNVAAASATLGAFDRVAQDTVSRLQSTMSPAGFQSLLDHVRGQKRYMKRVPYPTS